MLLVPWVFLFLCTAGEKRNRKCSNVSFCVSVCVCVGVEGRLSFFVSQFYFDLDTSYEIRAVYVRLLLLCFPWSASEIGCLEFPSVVCSKPFSCMCPVKFINVFELSPL